MSSDAIVWQLHRAQWRQLQRGVYALFTGPPEREATLWAAVLRSGQDAMLSYHSAAELAQLIDEPSALVHVTVPASRRVRSITGVIIHLSCRASEARHPCLLPLRTRIEETVRHPPGQRGCG